mmetsp:Transcript_14064/g.38461  ORF Transcript_14064/g.38461 Transcript_14064/m.38461 type:complete len:494 (-) Transcript_14064:101-1582(-)
MFADFEVPGCASATKVFVRKNGTAAPLKEVVLPPHSKLSDLFDKSGKALDIDAPLRAFYSNGVECTDVDNMEEDEVINISCGEDFKASSATDAVIQVIGNYYLQEKLGQGGFGSVIKGVHSETGEAAAVKFVPKKSFRQFSDLQRVFQEIQALRNLRHPNIVRILDVADHPDSICFIMEFAAGGELRGYVERHKFLQEEEARSFFKQIVRAVHYIHSKKIIHRDLKLENILLDSRNCCKIVDFGLSDYVSTKVRTVTDAGTEAYLAPEVYSGHSRDSDPYKIDVWGLGVILFALAHGKLPFHRPDEETCAKLDADGLTFKEEMTEGYRCLVKIMLTPRAGKRASMNEITLDPWVTKNRFAECELFGSLSDDDEAPFDIEDTRKGLTVERHHRERSEDGHSGCDLVGVAGAVAPNAGERPGSNQEIPRSQLPQHRHRDVGRNRSNLQAVTERGRMERQRPAAQPGAWNTRIGMSPPRADSKGAGLRRMHRGHDR